MLLPYLLPFLFFFPSEVNTSQDFKTVNDAINFVIKQTEEEFPGVEASLYDLYVTSEDVELLVVHFHLIIEVDHTIRTFAIIEANSSGVAASCSVELILFAQVG